MSSPYRTQPVRSEDGSWIVGPIYKKHEKNNIVRIERKFTMDGWVTWDVGIWNGQRDGEPTIAIKMGLVATQQQWDAYKKAVDELWEEWNKHETPKS